MSAIIDDPPDEIIVGCTSDDEARIEDLEDPMFTARSLPPVAADEASDALSDRAPSTGGGRDPNDGIGDAPDAGSVEAPGAEEDGAPSIVESGVIEAGEREPFESVAPIPLSAVPEVEAELGSKLPKDEEGSPSEFEPLGGCAPEEGLLATPVRSGVAVVAACGCSIPDLIILASTNRAPEDPKDTVSEPTFIGGRPGDKIVDAPPNEGAIRRPLGPIDPIFPSMVTAGAVLPMGLSIADGPFSMLDRGTITWPSDCSIAA